MTAAFTIHATSGFRDASGRFAVATQDLLESRRDLMRTQAQRFVQLAGQEAPGGTGHTVADQITYETYNTGDTMGFRIKMGQIAHWQLEGTGIYGPHSSLIVPLRAQVLHFFVKGEEFFRRAARGVKPNDYVGRAYDQWVSGARDDLHSIALRFIAKFKGGYQ